MTDNIKHPIRVLQITGIACRGGVESVVMNWYRNINREAIQFDFLIDGYEKSLLDDEIISIGGVPYKTERYKKNMLKTMLDVYRVVKQHKYRIVHCHMSTLTPFYLLPAWLAGAKVRIAHSHGSGTPQERLRYLVKLILRPFVPLFATDLFACSKNAGYWMFGKKRMEKGQVTVINNAIDLDKFRYRPDVRESVRKKLDLENNFVVGHVGRFMPPKNHDFLIDIFAEIHKRQPNARLMLVGDGPLRTQIGQKVKALGLQDVVSFLGLRSDVPDLLQAMDVFVLPSFYEGNPVVAIEAQASAVPFLTSTAVTEESQVASCFKRIPLEAGAKAWAEEAIALGQMAKIDRVNEVRASGFDIIEIVTTISKTYFLMDKDYEK